ncbi:MAG: hypothetical protein WBD47_16680 [Phormidesmis sp.]
MKTALAEMRSRLRLVSDRTSCSSRRRCQTAYGSTQTLCGYISPSLHCSRTPDRFFRAAVRFCPTAWRYSQPSSRFFPASSRTYRATPRISQHS